jgi:tetratricopeptide (TPR) repeat protein
MLAPFALLLAVEWGLRISGNHIPTGFWLETEQEGRNRRILDANPAFGARFVGPTLARMPRPLRVPQYGGSETHRVLVFGESAALGDPEPAFGLTRFLQAELENRTNGSNPEVLNLGITALNSFALREIVRDSSELRMGAVGCDWVFYPGNNEVHGPFGPGSGLTGPAPSRTTVLATLALRRTAIGQWIQRQRLAKPEGLSMTQRFAGLEMFTGNHVRSSDPAVAQVHAKFEANLEDMVHLALKGGAVRVVLVTMAVNLTDSPPFGSDLTSLTNSPAYPAWTNAVELARRSEEQADPAEPVRLWTQASKLAPGHAETRYRLGLAKANAGDAAGARADLEAARDLDTLRFRADSGINEAIRRVAAKFQDAGSEKVVLVDAARELSGDDPGRPPGADLFYEHVHLRPEGNHRLATLVADALSPRGPAPLSFEAARARLGWTPQAESRIWTQIRSLVRRPPFSFQSNAESRNRYLDDRLAESTAQGRKLGLNAALEQVASTLAKHTNDWELREQHARLLHTGRRWTNAAAEWARIVDQAPNHLLAWYQLGEAKAKSGDFAGAIPAYRRALTIRPDFTDAGIGLGIALGQSGRLAEALAAMDETLSFDPSNADARVNRAITLNALGRADEAADDLRRAAAENRESSLPLVRLAEMQSGRKEFAKAAETLAEAVKREPRNAALYHRLATEMGRGGLLLESEAAFRKALELDPTFLSARVDLGVALAQQRRFADAVVEFEAALRQQPNHPTAGTFLDRARQMLQTKGANP